MAQNGKGNIKEQKKRYRLKHPDKISGTNKRVNVKRRKEVISHYSNGLLKCSRCGETHIEFLEVVCIDGETKIHSGTIRYSYLKSNGYPAGFIVLCSNCNLKRIRERARVKGLQGTYSERKYYRRSLNKLVDILEHYKTDDKIKCCCCGAEDKDTLCLDHKNGDGAQHRKIVSSAILYSWIIKNGYPGMFRLLCANCNQSLGSRGYCPHNTTIQ
jgi:hypothetical protein